LFTQTEAYRKELGDNLVVKSLAYEKDIERLAAFNGTIHDEGVAAMTRELITHHPHTRPEHWLYVEDESTEQIVSSLCLIPWTWRYEDVELKAGEMGIVCTLPAYRHRGLIRAQAVHHAELLREGEYDLSQIQGIPYFYRQFGYEYAVPLAGGWRVDLHLIPEASPDDPQPYFFRLANLADLPSLMRLYDEAADDLNIHTVRDEAEWRYLFGPSTQTEMVAETWLVLDAEQEPIAYLRVPQHGFGTGLIVNEVSRLSAETAMAVLRHLKVLGQERNKLTIRLCLPAESTLIQAARYRGAHDMGSYAWQIRLVDVGRLLKKLAPVLERRIDNSSLAGLTRNVCLNLYREAFELRFEKGKLTAVEPLGFSDRGGIRIPPRVFAPLVLGYRSREELRYARPDVSIGGEWQHLVDVLFPKMSSFIYTVY
jgi:predicted acetyltransferase